MNCDEGSRKPWRIRQKTCPVADRTYTPTWLSYLTQAALERARPPTEEAGVQLKPTVKELTAGGCVLTAFPAVRRQALPWKGTGGCISLPTMLPHLSIVNTAFILISFNKQKVLPFHIFGVEFEITITVSIPRINRWSILCFWEGWNYLGRLKSSPSETFIKYLLHGSLWKSKRWIKTLFPWTLGN